MRLAAKKPAGNPVPNPPHRSGRIPAQRRASHHPTQLAPHCVGGQARGRGGRGGGRGGGGRALEDGAVVSGTGRGGRGEEHHKGHLQEMQRVEDPGQLRGCRRLLRFLVPRSRSNLFPIYQGFNIHSLLFCCFSLCWLCSGSLQTSAMDLYKFASRQRGKHPVFLESSNRNFKTLCTR